MKKGGSFFRKKDESKKKKTSKAPDPDAHIKLAKEQALREKVEDAQRIAAVEKVKMLTEKDKYEMLIGRKELATRYHKYLNKQIKERRVLYVMINVDGTHAGPDVGSEWEEPSPTEPVTSKIRVKIKSGQDADFIAANLIDRYGLAVAHLGTIRKTLTLAIEKHEADNKLYEAEVAKVGMLIAPTGEDSDDDGDDDDDEEVVADSYLLMKKRLVKARRLAKDFEKQRLKIEADLHSHEVAPKVSYDGGEPSEELLKELMFERDRYKSIKHQLITSRDKVMATQKERRQLDSYKQKLLAKIVEANRAASGEISVAAFWEDYSMDNHDKILQGNSDDDSDDDGDGEEGSEDVSDEEFDKVNKKGSGDKKEGATKAAEAVLSSGMKEMSSFLNKSATSFRENIGDEKELFNSLSSQIPVSSSDQIVSSFDDAFQNANNVFQEKSKEGKDEQNEEMKKDNNDNSNNNGSTTPKKKKKKKEEGGGDGGIDTENGDSSDEQEDQANTGAGGDNSDNTGADFVNMADFIRKGTTMVGGENNETSDEMSSSSSLANKRTINVDELPDQHRPSIFETMVATIGGSNAKRFGPQNVSEEEFSELPSPNQMAGYLVRLDVIPTSY